MPSSFHRQKSIYRNVLFLIILFVAPATAAIIGISITPTEVRIGTISLCSPNEYNNSDPIVGTTWSQRKLFPCGNWTSWQILGTGQEQELRGEYPLTYEMKLETTYGSVPGMPIPHAPTTHISSRTVFPANGVRDDEGFNIETPVGNARTIKYHVQRNSQDCGPYLGGIAQERLRDIFEAGAGNLPDWDAWFPSSPSPTFQLIGGRILDEHSASTIHWQSVPTPGIIASAVQELQISWSCPWMHDYSQNLGSQQIVHRKVSSTSWKVEH